MKILNELYYDKAFDYSLFDFYFKDLKYGIFDIETTGLSPEKSQLVLSGFVIPQENGSMLCKQIFAESLDEEALVIEETLNILNDLDFIVTFNGRRFDVPFLKKRMIANNIKNDYIPYDLDLYPIIRYYSQLKDFLPRLNQKSIENYMGISIERDDEIDGAASVEMYFEYLITKDAPLEQKILLHNSDDVKQLYRLLDVLRQCNIHRSMCRYGFPCNEFHIDKISLSTKKLTIKGHKVGAPFYYEEYDDESQIAYSFQGSKFSITIQLISEDVLVFADLNALNMDVKLYDNCNALYGHYLVLAVNKEANHLAITTLIKNLLERITQL